MPKQVNYISMCSFVFFLSFIWGPLHFSVRVFPFYSHFSVIQTVTRGRPTHAHIHKTLKLVRVSVIFYIIPPRSFVIWNTFKWLTYFQNSNLTPSKHFHTNLVQHSGNFHKWQRKNCYILKKEKHIEKLLF